MADGIEAIMDANACEGERRKRRFKGVLIWGIKSLANCEVVEFREWTFVAILVWNDL